MKTQCPFCKKVFKAPEVYKGKMIHCPDCKEHFLISEYHPQTVKPETIEKAKTVAKEKTKDNIFTMVWKRSPAPFRIGFLSTIGVIAALFVSWHFFNFSGNFFSRPSKIASQVHPPKTVTSPPSSSPSVFDLYYLAAAIRINQYMSKLESLQQSRVTASGMYVDKGDLHSFAKIARCTCLQLKDLNETVYRMQIPNNEELKRSHRLLRTAIQSEYKFQESLIGIIGTQRSSDLGKIESLSKEAVSDFNVAMACAVLILWQHDPLLLEAIVVIDGEE